MPVKSLYELATATCVKNLKGLDSIGDYLPYEAVRHILLKVEAAHQLRQIELNSPQIQGQTGEIWLKLIEKDFPMEYKAKAYKPQDPDKWYRVWEKYKKDHDAALRASEDILKQALNGLRQDKEKNVSRIVERKLLPKQLRMAGARKMYSGARDAHSNTLSFNSGSRTKTASGAGVMRKVRREVKEIATIHGALSKPIRGPARLSQLQRAPQSMVNDYRRASQPQYRSSAQSPEPPSLLAEHEERATFISDSEDDDDDENEDGLFDDHDKGQDNELPRQASKPLSKSGGRAAAVSLLKRRADQTHTTSASPSQNARPARPAPAPAVSAVKRGSGLLSNKYKGAATAERRPISSASSPPPKAVTQPTLRQTEATKAARLPPPVRTSPPRTSSARPSSSPPLPDSLPQVPLAGSHAAPRKRKAVTHFIRPKKR
ncbi:RNA polymerase II transcription factor SIII, subunit A [Moelleriella libera RCEF 2490]|uniref:RNA polymerase II transcription factor SIII, subunit A n=1 Tax=Moelleriella libera RCEF 2490 TaxID=1081109 RepID=A0A168B347_9HYPO|nr:RNA polymerase II transcription factor SIII, subunit A [Moelleriella libera RCEF 2490]